MKRIARVALPLLLLSLAACGGGGGGGDKETEALRQELADLKEQATSSSTTTTTVAAPPPVETTTTSRAPAATVKPKPTAAPTTTAPPTTATAAPSTTTTTVRLPEGIVSWNVVSSQVVENCAYAKLHLINKSDTAVRAVTLKYPTVAEAYTAEDGSAQTRWGMVLPDQGAEVGLAALGGVGDINLKWCPDTIGAGTTRWWVNYGVYKQDSGRFAHLLWDWFGDFPQECRNGGCMSYQNM
jgi:hypothetical protein